MFPIAFRAHWSDRIRRQRVRHVTLVATGAAAVAGGVYYATLSQQPRTSLRPKVKVKLPRPLMEAVFGAIGEIAQVAVLYPLDTVKVRCQAAGCSAAVVMQELLRGGLNIKVVQQLYAGVISASLCSVVVGSVYYLSFCESKRCIARLAQARSAQPSTQPSTPPSPGSTPSPAPLPPSAPSAAKGPTTTAATTSTTTAAAAVTASAAGGPGAASVAAPPSDSLSINVLAAVSAALVGAIIEAPVELFKNQTKAGILQGNMLAHMGRMLRTGGLRSWYWGFLPFCLKSLPYDIGELLTYSQLRDGYDFIKSSQSEGRFSLASTVPEHVWDAGIGAAAGAAAVLVSMPADCLKTVMDPRVLGPGPATMAESAAAFMATGRGMVAAKGPGALFNGLLPRLGEKVPSTMLYWLAVEACRRGCEPYMSDDEGSKSDQE